MRLNSILGKIGIGSWVITKKPFMVQWNKGVKKCTKGERLEPQMRGPNEVARICDITFEAGRADAGTEGLYTVTCEFLYGGLNGGGSIGTASAATLEELVAPGKQ